MFLFTGALFVLCGLLLLAKARKMNPLALLVGICAVVLMFLGLRLIFYAFTTV